LIKLVILDVDGVLTDGSKYYDNSGNGVYKTFCDKDFTAIKRLVSRGVKVCFLSGDNNVNQAVAENRNIDFYYSRGKNKTQFLEEFSQKYNCSRSEMAAIGDDLFDLDLLKSVGHSYCPSDACRELRDSDGDIICLNSKGGKNVIMELFYTLCDSNLIPAQDNLDKFQSLDNEEKF
jgi:3-deoxy-D-manno-octulosonate 8-phosphate phosphatase (KDO 8-P phosphatase)